MAFVQLDLDGIKRAQAAAGIIGLSPPQVIGGLALLWDQCRRERTALVARIQLEALFWAPNSPRLAEALVAFGFLEETAEPEEWRVRGLGRYRPLDEAQLLGRQKGGLAARGNLVQFRKSSREKTDHQSPAETPAVSRSSAGEQPVETPAATGSFTRDPRSDTKTPASETQHTKRDSQESLSLGAGPEPPDPKLPRAQSEADATEAVALWNRLAHPDFARVSRLTPGRRKAIRAAIALLPLADWPAAIAAVNAWPWAHGQDGGGTWRASFDWLLATDKHRTPNLLRAAEGQLNSKTSPQTRRDFRSLAKLDQPPRPALGEVKA